MLPSLFPDIGRLWAGSLFLVYFVIFPFWGDIVSIGKNNSRFTIQHDETAFRHLQWEHRHLLQLPAHCLLWHQHIHCLPQKESSDNEKNLSLRFVKTFHLQAKMKKKEFLQPALKVESFLHRPKPDKNSEIRGLYSNIIKTQSRSLSPLLGKMENGNLNGLVFDVHNVEGQIAFTLVTPLLQNTFAWQYPQRRSLESMVTELRQRGIRPIARIVIFQEERLAKTKAEWAVKTRSGHSSTRWLNPLHPQVRAIYVDFIYELAMRGVTEIQLDYIRFPSWDEVPYPSFHFPKGENRIQVITNFLKDIQTKIAGLPVLISADTFGITAWYTRENLSIIGQNFQEMGRHLDIISPMLYPSHFDYGFGGFDNPADQPEYFLQQGIKKMKEQNQGVIRPWLQAFPYRVSRFSHSYIKRQIEAAASAGANGFLLWHAGSNYDVYFKRGS